MAARSPRELRDTFMLAMLTPSSPSSVPTRPIMPGPVVVQHEQHGAGELDLDLVAATSTSHGRLSRPIIVPATGLAVAAGDADQVRVVAGDAALASRTSMPRASATVRAFTRFTGSSSARRRRPTQHRERQQARVALGERARRR